MLHVCNDDSFKDGLLIDTLWWENASNSKFQNIEDVYILINGILKIEDFELSPCFSFFCNAKRISKRFYQVNDIDDKSKDYVLRYEKSLISSYKTTSITPLLSIVTTVYNNAILLEQTIQSVINQKTDKIDYIIKDACSTDNFDEIVHRYAKYNINVVKCKDFGIYDGMEQGFEAASGEYVQILNSDDVFYNSEVTNSYIAEIKNNASDAFCSNILLCFPNCKQIIRKPNLKKLRYQSCINHTSLVLKKSDYFRLGGFDKNLKIAADCDLTIKMAKDGLIIKRIPMISVNFRMGGTSSKISWRQLREGLICRYRYSFFNIDGYIFTILQFIKNRYFN